MEKFRHKFKIYKNGFTLAEVLITLVIIGIVAAMTIPTAIAKYQKAETVNRLKQVFSQFNQAVRLSTSKYGDTSTWDYSLSGFDFFNTYLNSFVVVEENRTPTSFLVMLVGDVLLRAKHPLFLVFVEI